MSKNKHLLSLAFKQQIMSYDQCFVDIWIYKEALVLIF
jgi:hypothetical protein